MLKHALAAGLLAAILAGCGAQKGETMITIGKDKEPGPLSEVTAEREGKYAVYPNASLTPVRVEMLEEGDEYGFRRLDNGKLAAVLGDREIPLEAGLSSGYYIKYQGRR